MDSSVQGMTDREELAKLLREPVIDENRIMAFVQAKVDAGVAAKMKAQSIITLSAHQRIVSAEIALAIAAAVAAERERCAAVAMAKMCEMALACDEWEEVAAAIREG